jgi:hypothetical protein
MIHCRFCAYRTQSSRSHSASDVERIDILLSVRLTNLEVSLLIEYFRAFGKILLAVAALKASGRSCSNIPINTTTLNQSV